MASPESHTTKRDSGLGGKAANMLGMSLFRAGPYDRNELRARNSSCRQTMSYLAVVSMALSRLAREWSPWNGSGRILTLYVRTLILFKHGKVINFL